MTTPSTEQTALTKEETAWLMRALWAALQAPAWESGNRKDLQKLGEALISGKTLKELPEDLLNRIFPHLKTVTLHLGTALKAKAYEDDNASATAPASPSAPAPAPAASQASSSGPSPHLSVVSTGEASPPTPDANTGTDKA